MMVRWYFILILMISYQLGYGQKIGIKDTIYLTLCDTSQHGNMVFDLESIKNSVFSSSQNTVSPTIFIATQGGNVIKVVDILTNPSIQTICQGLNASFTDIAINKDQVIYLCTTKAIYVLNSSTCTIQLFYQFNSSANLLALSFDTKNNLYYSDGTAVYRFNNTTGTPVLWHDFGTGYASGDFVMKNGKMYIAWVLLGEVRLYEITVDNNINFVSFQNKCLLKPKTYGLASELGVLYGVTPTELYKIDDNTCQFSNIKSNSGLSWYGAAGLHEAQSSITAHLNYSDAVSIINEIKGKWTNTIPYNQLIYLTVDDKIKDSLFIYPVKIRIIPSISNVINKTICKGSTYEGHNTAGLYKNTFKSIDGCDSMRTLNLRVVDTIFDTLKATICQGASYRSKNATGTYYENYKTSAGCDSIIVIILKVNNVSYSIINWTICQGKSYMGKKNAGIYKDTFKNYLGCDSIRTLNLSVINIPKPVIDVYKCILSGKKIKFFTQEISAPGIYIDSTNHTQECDTIYRWNVSLIKPIKIVSKSTHCQGYYMKGNFLYKDTILLDTIKSFLGCDSVYKTDDITIQQLIKQNTIFKNYCDTFSFKNIVMDRDTYLMDVTKYSEPPYCDSLKQIYRYTKVSKPKVSILAPMGIVCTKGEFLRLEALGANTYLWSTNDTASNIIISPSVNSTYVLKGWNPYHCVDSTSIDIEVEDTVYFDVPNVFSPNEDGSNDLFGPNTNGKIEILTFEIYNRWGEKVFVGNQRNYFWNGYYKDILQPNGIYTYQLIVRKNRKIIEKKGSLTLIR